MTTHLLGIDLGTSRTSVITNTGARCTIETVVGYAKDAITKKRFNKDYLIGEEARKNRLALNLVEPLSGGIIEDNERCKGATSLLLKHIIASVIPNKKKDDEIYAIIGVPALASTKSKKAILEVTKGFIDKVMVISEPFAVAYALDKLYETLVIDIGHGSVDLARLEGTFCDEHNQITIDKAGRFLDKCITDEILKKYPDVQITPQIVKRIKEKHGYVSNTSDPIEVTLTSKGKPGKYDITDIMREACLTLAKPICEAVQSLISEADPEFQETFRNNILIAGGGSRLKGIDRAIEDCLQEYGGGNAECVQDAEFCGAEGAFKLCIEMDDDLWDQLNES
jgi:rod shape-determining protein MreB and related proteins